MQTFAGPPPTCIDPDATYTATFTTTKGDFTATLDPQRAPVTVNNFVVLARYHFYDGVPFHRIVPGLRDPGRRRRRRTVGQQRAWATRSPTSCPAGPAEYTDYSLAMANSGPNTNGSQFFVVLPGGGAQLNPANYSLFGQVTEGTDVVDAIGALGNAEQEPTEAVVVEKVTITETK